MAKTTTVIDNGGNGNARFTAYGNNERGGVVVGYGATRADAKSDLKAKLAPAPRAPKGTPTSLNISTLARAAAGRREFPNQLEPTSTAGVRRCLKAGLVEVINPTTLRLTDAGVAAINASSCTKIGAAS
jgi:hypothetical protein